MQPRECLCNPLDHIQVGPVAFARFDGAPLPRGVLQPTSPRGQKGAVLGMACPDFHLDHPQLLRSTSEELAGGTFAPPGAKWGPPLTLSSRPSSSAPDPCPSGVESLKREPGWNGSGSVGQASG